MSSTSLPSSMRSLHSFFSSSSSSSRLSGSSTSVCSGSSTSPPSSSVFTTSFTQDASSRLTFSSFPPTGFSRQCLDNTSSQVARALLHDHKTYISILNPLFTEYHEIVQSPPEPEKLDPIILLAEFSDPALSEGMSGATSTCSPFPRPSYPGDWKYYTVSDILPLPGRVIKSKTTYDVALRLTADGIESLVVAENYFVLHTLLRIMSRGSNTEEELAGESLWLVETAELRCWRGLAWYMEMNMGDNRTVAHERFRVRWDAEVLEALDKTRRVNLGCTL